MAAHPIRFGIQTGATERRVVNHARSVAEGRRPGAMTRSGRSITFYPIFVDPEGALPRGVDGP